MLKGKKILLGVTGGIAAYKIPSLVRIFVQAGADVKVILTPSASAFVTPLTLATVSQHPVFTELFDAQTGMWTNHVEFGTWADLMLIAPCSANTLSKMAQGASDNLLLTTFLSARCPVWVAPAMDLDMYAHPATQRNLQTLTQDGCTILPAASGFLASGLHGQGRMQEPEQIAEQVRQFFETNQPLHGKSILVTAGPTYEPIDPVRFIGNHSTGKMGVELADCLAGLGATVHLVLGPSGLKPTHSRVQVHSVNTAVEMLHVCTELFPRMDGAIAAAAVADYRVENPASEKIKKNEASLVLTLVKNPDILATMGNLKQPHQVLAGFALETHAEKEHALAKREKKNLDFIVLNSLQNPGAGFKVDTNQISIADAHNTWTDFELTTKKEVARQIATYFVNVLAQKNK